MPVLAQCISILLTCKDPGAPFHHGRAGHSLLPAQIQTEALRHLDPVSRCYYGGL